MIDPRVTKLANVFVNYSCAVKPGDKVLMELIDTPNEFAAECTRLITEAGGLPFVWLKTNVVNRALLRNGTQEQWEITAQAERFLMEQMDCFIGVRGTTNSSELSDVPNEKQDIFDSTIFEKVHAQVRIPKTRWAVTRWPSANVAQLADMSTEAFEDFFFNVCTLDYGKMKKAMQPLKTRMAKADAVKIVGPNDTDLTFSIKGITANACAGERNIPDGEVYTAPVRESVNGVIRYNTPTRSRGILHEDIRFVFKDGKIVEATSSNSKALNEVLDVDEGARYIGEFAIGVNPYITKPMQDTLFDEKIAGSIHFTPGMAYDETNNGNVSQVHWDIVMIQTAEHGGGEMYFDGELIRKDGLFVPEDLQPLNPENLM